MKLDFRRYLSTKSTPDSAQDDALADEFHLGECAVREVLTDLETRGFVETWIESRGRGGRVKQIETTFKPQWVREVTVLYVRQSDQIS